MPVERHVATLLLEDLEGKGKEMLFAFGWGHVGEVKIKAERGKKHQTSIKFPMT